MAATRPDDEPVLLHKETDAPCPILATYRGPRRQVFVAGVVDRKGGSLTLKLPDILSPCHFDSNRVLASATFGRFATACRTAACVAANSSPVISMRGPLTRALPTPSSCCTCLIS